MSILDVITRQRKRAEEVASEYDKAVRSIVAGSPPSDEELASTLRRAGKSAADLEKDVAALAELRRLQRIASEGPVVTKRLAEIDDAIGAARRKLDAAQTAFDNLVGPLESERRELRRKRGPIHDARHKLLKSSCHAPELARCEREIAKVRADRAAAEKKIAECAALATQIEAKFAAAESQHEREAARTWSGEKITALAIDGLAGKPIAEKRADAAADQEYLQRAVATCKQTVKDCEAKLPKLEAEREQVLALVFSL
jgi:hypothetical protein